MGSGGLSHQIIDEELDQTVIDALVNAAKAKLQAAVDAGKIKPERAAQIEAKLPDRVAKLVNEWHPKHLGQHAAA